MHVKSILVTAAVAGTVVYGLGSYYGWPARGESQNPLERALAQEKRTAEEALQPAIDLAQAQRPPAGQPAPAPPVVDESALRYFAQQGDTRRLEAEMARLRALYPEWKPPADLTGTVARVDPELERMWKLFGESKLGELRAAIAQRSAGDPNWQPPADLVQQLDQAEARQRLVNASNAKQWEQVIRIGTDTPALLTCANVDSLWRVAEAFVQTKRPDRARDAYSYVLTNCTDPADRLATMQKVLPALPEEMTLALLAQERNGEFSSIRDELARQRIGRAAENPPLTATPEELRRIEALATAATTPDDAILLGFYALHHNDAAKAVTWFKTALSRNGGAKAAEGAVLALSAVKDHLQAEELGSQWLEAGAANRKAYLDAATALIAQEPPPRLSEAIVTRIARTVGSERYASGASGLGWYAYNSGQVEAAGEWFKTALGWDRNLEQAAYGLALVRQRLRDRAGLLAIVSEWGARSQRIADILRPGRQAAPAREVREIPLPAAVPESVPREGPRLPARVARAASPPAAIEDEVPSRSAEPAAPRRAASGGGRAGAAALAQGWRLLDLKRPAAAIEAFDIAQRTGSAQVAGDAAAGKVYAQLQQGLTAEANVSAASAPIPQARRRELTALILSERFYALYDAKNYNAALLVLGERARYAPETTDLMMSRGWSYFNLGRYADARKVFSALHRANGSPQAQSGLTAIDEVTKITRY
ncbi:hypothetical protein ASE63_11675 [Bosea sp. Root381]|uniref:tetratricopeptide repeat protein n=1 Tax=Bosea sp. Root381 TaxID=1736524 RepID=UPI0006F820AD|nr:tetratricopeptide repeat protein [Bosea sp. Root381]KRD96346.1 hypothetical protein ASE63_11675 [Bosea sp. Root381]